MEKCELFYQLKQDNISVVGFKRKCRYHKCEQTYSSTKMSPDGLCLAAFAVLYPYCLSMLSRAKYHRAENKEVCRITCPGNQGAVEFNIFRKPFKRQGFKMLIFYFKKLVDFFIPVELLEHRVFIEVIRTDKNCPFSYKEGKVFEFDIGDKKEICPAAFYSLYPFSLSFFEKNGNLRDSQQVNNLNCQIPCSDYNTNIIFQLGNQDKENNNPNEHFFHNCDDYNDIYLKIKSIQNCSNSYFKENMEFNVNWLIKDMDIPCFSVFYNAFPYMLALEKGGSLGFLTFDRNAAGIQCPNLAVQVSMFIKKDRKNGSYFIDILDSKGECPKGIKKKERYKLPDFLNNKFDIIALANIFPYIMHLKYFNNCKKGSPKIINFSYFNNLSYAEFQIYRK